jgi:hypothetical protein
MLLKDVVIYKIGDCNSEILTTQVYVLRYVIMETFWYRIILVNSRSLAKILCSVFVAPKYARYDIFATSLTLSGRFWLLMAHFPAVYLLIFHDTISSVT